MFITTEMPGNYFGQFRNTRKQITGESLWWSQAATRTDPSRRLMLSVTWKNPIISVFPLGEDPVCPVYKTIIKTADLAGRKTILYADDDVDDKEWITDACKAENLPLQFLFFDNGKDVIRFLDNKKPTEHPSLIVLDLNMPGMDGRQTLKQLKSDARYCDIPVAVVTTSSSRIDIDVCRKLGAGIFLTKPDNFARWKEMVKKLGTFT